MASRAWIVSTGLAMVAALMSLASCRRAVEDAQPVECLKVGQTCKLGPGLLGVCTEGASDKCDHDPCLVCMGQH